VDPAIAGEFTSIESDWIRVADDLIRSPVLGFLLLQLFDCKESSLRGVHCSLTREHNEAQQSAAEPRKIPITTLRVDGDRR
jgi:hypothetical protein